MELLPPAPEGLDLLHDRDYAVRVLRESDTSLFVQAAVQDLKSGAAYFDDPTEPPIRLHHMVIEARVSYPELVITQVSVAFNSHPQPGCPAVADRYGQLVGLSIARGFTHKVRELFGGVNGCAHVTALLQAMAPAVVQSVFSVRAGQISRGVISPPEMERTPEGLRSRYKGTINTCAVWDENGEMVGRIMKGESVTPGIPIRRRIEERGEDVAYWQQRYGG